MFIFVKQHSKFSVRQELNFQTLFEWLLQTVVHWRIFIDFTQDESKEQEIYELRHTRSGLRSDA
jgi:hypothetical protein